MCQMPDTSLVKPDSAMHKKSGLELKNVSIFVDKIDNQLKIL